MITETVETAKDHKGITAVIAINYGGRDEIVRSVNRLIASNRRKSPSAITSNVDLPRSRPWI